MVMPAGTILVIGAGSIGQRHFQNLQHLGAKAELLPWRNFDADKLDARDDISGVVIATQTRIRLELIEQCARRGWPFYAEKPLAWRSEQVDAIYRAAAPVAQKSMIGFMMRYHPVLRALSKLDLGDIFRFHAEIGHDVRKWRANWRFAESYAAEAEGGGVLLDLCHEIDLVVALFGPLALTQARCIGHAAYDGVDFATLLSLTGANGIVGVVAMDYVSPIFIRKMQFTGARQRIDVDFQTAEMTIQTIDANGQTASATHNFVFERNDMFLAAMTDFLGLVSGAALSEDPLRPRFDRMRPTNDLIAAAWGARQFDGQVQLEI